VDLGAPTEHDLLRQVLKEHDALGPHACAPLGKVCPFILERGHALGVHFPHCKCQECAAWTLHKEHEALMREADETGQPVHVCPAHIDAVCSFVWDRGHALGVRFFGCACPGCAT
jgi:hypothetical protein